MSAIRLYVDEDAAEAAVIDGLRSRGINVVSVFDVSMDRASDEEQLEFAASAGRVLYSLNVSDCCRIHTEWLANNQQHQGIFLITRQRFSVGEKIRRIEEFVSRVTAEEMLDRLEFL